MKIKAKEVNADHIGWTVVCKREYKIVIEEVRVTENRAEFFGHSVKYGVRDSVGYSLDNEVTLIPPPKKTFRIAAGDLNNSHIGLKGVAIHGGENKALLGGQTLDQVLNWNAGEVNLVFYPRHIDEDGYRVTSRTMIEFEERD
jgi:hypothetical protein